MKKKLVIMTALLALVMGSKANPITRAEARLVAQEFVGIDDASTDDVPVAPYYVFSRGAGQGFVIVSGDDDTVPIIGYTDSGDFVAGQMPAPLEELLGNWGEKIAKVQAAPRRKAARRSVSERLRAERHGVEAFKASWTDVPVLCPTRWNQGAPYNNLCPLNPANSSQRAVTGCVATAAAQIIYYFHKDNPDTLIYNTPTYTMDWGSSYGNYPVTESLPAGTPIEYDQMKMSGSGTTRQNKAVATLMYAIGTSSRLNYGSSTAGQPNEAGAAMSSQFWLDNDYHGKWDYSQTGWERLIYASLQAGSPMLYGGTSPTSGGHAVVLDGYQASTGLYHFNFGWGGSGDGWYTVDDETGMNGFNSDQRGCLNFSPRKPNISGKLLVNGLYSRTTSTIRAQIENNGTLNCSNFGLYVSTNGRLPSSASKTDKDLVLKPGESGEVVFTYRPSTANVVYLFLCDAKKNILDSCHFEVVPSLADLTLENLQVDNGGVTTEVDGMTFGMVNNTTAIVTASITNSQDATLCQPSLNCHVCSYDRDSKEWTEETHLYLASDVFEQGETRNVAFTFRNLKEDKLYKAYIDREVRSQVTNELHYNTPDTAVYFTVRPADFQMTVDGRKAVATGNWNQNLFSAVSGVADVLSFDLTGVADLTVPPVAPNPNAVFYTSAPIAGAANVVANGICDSLVVCQGSEFLPEKPFQVGKATFVLAVDRGGVWGDALVPFAVTVPFGMQAKQLTGVSTIVMTAENVRQIEPMSPVIYLADRDGMNRLSGQNVAVGTDSVVSVADGVILASTLTSMAETSSMVFGYKNNVPYYLPVSGNPTVAPFGTVVTKFSNSGYRAVPVTETRYTELAEGIRSAYIVLAENRAWATPEALEKFLASIDRAENVFTYLTAESSAQTREETELLAKAVEEFLADVATGIETPVVDAGEQAGQAPVEYYSLSGIRLERPERGIVIMKQGARVRKVMIKN